MNALEIHGLTKEYADGTRAVDDLSLTLPEGDFLVLLGPSGCGKSTTLRCIAGLEDVTSGEIRIGGEDVTDRRPEDRNIAMVFQNYALYPHMTARQNVGFGLKMTTDLSQSEIDDRVDRVARTMGIEDLLENRPKELSGGQQQRVALGRAIVREPDVFLMDEPLSNLDATLRAEMRTEIQRLQDELDVTTVYVTHDQTEAMTMADRVAVLDRGRLQQVGSPLECYHRPANQFVAGFVGEPSMNVVETRREGDRLVFGDGATFSLTGRMRDRVGTTARVALGVRPPGLELLPDGPDGVDTDYDARVELVEPVGERTYVYCSVAGREVVVETDDAHGVDGRVGVRFPPERVHLFDADTGEALVSPDPDAVAAPAIDVDADGD
jgi:multiple sugar transport system ATP-binding protein